MIKLIVGNKGSGKTKTLIHMVNEAAQASNGNVVCIEKGLKLTYDLDMKVRLIDIDDYNVSGSDAFYGFLCGLLAGNYDITDLCIDATLKIVGRDLAAFAAMVEKLESLHGQNVNLIFTVSCDKSEIPDSITKFII